MFINIALISRFIEADGQKENGLEFSNPIRMVATVFDVDLHSNCFQNIFVE